MQQEDGIRHKATTSLVRMNTESWLLLSLLGMIWGSAFPIAAIAVRDIPPGTTVMLRAALASGLLYLLLRQHGIALPAGWRGWMPFVALGLFNTAIPFTLIAWGLTRIESGLAGILTATVPIFTVIVAHIVTKDERATGAKVTGIAVGMAGVVMIFGLDSRALTSGSGLAMLAILGASLLYAASAIYARTLRGVPSMMLAFGQLATATVLIIPWVLVVERPTSTAAWTWQALSAVIVLGILGSATGYLIFYRLLTTVGATSASLVTYLIPMVAVLLGAMLLGERLGAAHLIGMALILCGMAIVDGRLTTWLVNGRKPRPGTA